MSQRIAQDRADRTETEDQRSTRTVMTDWDAGGDDTVLSAEDTMLAVLEPPHQLEKVVARVLRGRSDLRFSSLVIRRLDNGVCIEGVVEVDEEGPDVGRLVRTVAGVDRVINRLVVRRRAARKG